MNIPRQSNVVYWVVAYYWFAKQGVLKCKMMLGNSLLTLTDFIPNTYVVREYSDKHLIQRKRVGLTGG